MPSGVCSAETDCVVLSSAPETLDVAEKHETRERVRKAVAGLPEEQRAVFLLREESGLPFREIAEILGCPLNTALGRMRYAMQNLRKTLAGSRKAPESETMNKK